MQRTCPRPGCQGSLWRTEYLQGRNAGKRSIISEIACLSCSRPLPQQPRQQQQRAAA